MNFAIYLFISASMFSMGLYGILTNRNNLMELLIYIQLMLLAINSNFIIFAKLWGELNGQILSLLILTLNMLQVAISVTIIMKIKNLNTKLLSSSKPNLEIDHD